MDILSEIIEISNEIINTLEDNGFFEENIFIDSLPLKRALQIRMQRKWEQENEMILTDDEFIEVCEEVKNIIEIIHPKREAHVMNIEFKVIGCVLLRGQDAVGRYINPCYGMSVCRQGAAVPAFSAGHVKHAASCRRLQMGQQLANESTCFGLIPVKV